MADWNIFQPTDASKPIHQILSGIQRGGFYVTNDNDEDRSRQALLDALAAAGYPAPSPTDPVYVHRTDTGNLERNTGNGWEIYPADRRQFLSGGQVFGTYGGTIRDEARAVLDMDKSGRGTVNLYLRLSGRTFEGGAHNELIGQITEALYPKEETTLSGHRASVDVTCNIASTGAVSVRRTSGAISGQPMYLSASYPIW